MNIGGLTSIPSNATPQQTEINGQPHMLAYINPQEAELLLARGGTGSPTVSGIPAFYNPADDMGIESSLSDQESVSAGMGSQSDSGDDNIGSVTFSVDDKGNISTIGGPNTNMGDTMTAPNFGGSTPADVNTTTLGTGGFADLGTGRRDDINLGYEAKNFLNKFNPEDLVKGGVTALSLFPNPAQPVAQLISKAMTLSDLVGIAQGDRSGIMGNIVGSLENTANSLSQPDLGSLTESLAAQARGE